MESMQKDVTKALNRAYFYLKFRPRTKREVILYLQKKSEKIYHWDPEVIDKVIELLEEEGLINDRAFIESFVSSRALIKPKGEFALRQELMKYGIDKDLLDEYFAEKPLMEEDLAGKAISTHWNRYKRFDKKTRFQKAVQFLMRRGFSFSVAKKVIEDFCNRH